MHTLLILFVLVRNLKCMVTKQVTMAEYKHYIPESESSFKGNIMVV